VRPIHHIGARMGVIPHPGTARPPHSRAMFTGQRGMVTVEAAIAIPALLVVGLLAAWMPALVAAQTACADAAREAALLAARGGTRAEVQALVTTLAPDGAGWRLDTASGTVTADVTASIPLGSGPLVGRMAIPLSGHAVAAREPGGWGEP